MYAGLSSLFDIIIISMRIFVKRYFKKIYRRAIFICRTKGL